MKLENRNSHGTLPPMPSIYYRIINFCQPPRVDG